MPMRSLLFILLGFVVWPAYAAAGAEPPVLSAVAMHGDPKYGPAFSHLDYVNPNAPKGGVLRLGTSGTYDSLNPFVLKGVPAAGLSYLGSGLLYESLLDSTRDEAFTEYGLLAKDIQMPEDRSWVVFTLREEARWHDGKPITADDVVWTFETLMSEGTPFYKAYYANVVRAEKMGPLKVKFHFDQAGNRELPLIMGQLTILPKHYWEGREFNKTTLEPPLGSGPYKVSEVKPGQRIVYERVKNWWGADLPLNRGRYNFDRIQYEYYRDTNVLLEAFFAGDYDIRYENTAKFWATGYDVPPVKDGRIIKAEIQHEVGAGMQGYIFNTRKPYFKERAVREALTYAFDFEWSNVQFAYGAYHRTDSYFENSELASSGLPDGRELEILESFRGQVPEDVFTKEYHPPKTDGSGNVRANLRTASQILDAAGWKLVDGMRQKDGVKLDFEILLNQGGAAYERWTQPMLRNFEKLGVKATIRLVDSAQYQKRAETFDFDMIIDAFRQSLSPGNEQRDFWGSEKADLEGSRNTIGIKDPVVDALIDMVIAAPSREELVYRTRALDRVLLWGHYVIPQWHLNVTRLAYWDKFGRPKTLAKYDPQAGVISTWWSAQ